MINYLYAVDIKYIYIYPSKGVTGTPGPPPGYALEYRFSNVPKELKFTNNDPSWTSLADTFCPEAVRRPAVNESPTMVGTQRLRTET